MIFINEKNDILKIIAIITMFIDHIGYGLLPKYPILRYIGRIAFPIFAYYVAMGSYHTKDIYRYAKRLLFFGIISQIPYALYFRSQPNIFFTLLLGVIAIHSLNKNKHIIAVLVCCVAQLIHSSYGMYGVLMIVLFHYYRENKNRLTISMFIITLTYSMYYNVYEQLYCLGALALIYRPSWELKINLNKYIYYSFYPVHILLLLLIKIIIK